MFSMVPTDLQLIRGSANINRMRSEIDLVTAMLFGLARHPSAWVRAHTLEHDWIRFHTRFGVLGITPAAWDVWWHEDTFHTRCLLPGESDGALLCAYRKEQERPTTHVQEFAEDLRYSGIQFAREHLDIFIVGMCDEFPIRHLTRPFVEAAAVD